MPVTTSGSPSYGHTRTRSPRPEPYAVSAALADHVRRIVFLSSAVGPGAMRIPHVASKAPVEHALITSRTDYTIVRAHSMFQNDLAVAGMIAKGHYPLPIGSLGISRVDVRDIATALATAALQSGFERHIYTLGTPERFTGESIARAYDTRYCGDDLDQWEHTVAATQPKWQRDDLRIIAGHLFLAHLELLDGLSIVPGRLFLAYLELLNQLLHVCLIARPRLEHLHQLR